MSNINIRNLSKSYGDKEILKKINLEIRNSEFLVLVGPSGCGKSTTLRLIAGLEDPSEGEIFIDDSLVNHIDPSKRDIAMVFQNYALYPQMSVRENMAFGLKIRNILKEEIDIRVIEAAEILQLVDLLDRKPKELSGGQRQRVALGRAIVRKPKVFLFDEPLSNLDAKLRQEMRLEIKKLHQLLDTTMIYVTHDQVEAMTLADRIVIMKDGIIEQIGTPLELFETPATKFVATFIGSPSMNMIDSTVEKIEDRLFLTTEGGMEIPVPKSKLSSVEIGQKIAFGFRAEDIVPVKFGNKPQQFWDMKSKVNLAEPLGTETLIFTNLGNIEIVSRMFTPELVKAGDILDFSLNLDRTYLFDNSTGKAI